jgi:phospholipid/cholesterol/gamma-HCH transport system substrate-binding protein
MTPPATTTSPNGVESREVIGLAFAVVAVVALGLIFTGLWRAPFAEDTRTVKVVFPDATLKVPGFLRKGAKLRMDGVDSGHVAKVTLDRAAQTSTVELEVNEDAGPIFADARATMRWFTLVGGDFYVDLDRGTEKAGELSGPIGPKQTASQVEVDDLTSVFRDDVRQGTRTLPGELARAFADRKPLPETLRVLGRMAPKAAPALHALRGEQPATDLEHLIEAAGTTVKALDTPNGELRTAVAGAATTLQTTAGRELELRRTIEQAPAALALTDATLKDLDRTFDVLDPLVEKLSGPAPDIAPTLAALRPTVIDGTRLLDRARPLFNALRPAASSLREASQVSLPLLKDVTPSLSRIDDKILPYFNEVDSGTKHTLSEMIGPALGVYAHSSGLVDSLGRMVRFPLGLGSSNLYAPCQTYLFNPDAESVVACQSLQEALDGFLNYNPLSPDTGADTTPESRKGRR